MGRPNRVSRRRSQFEQLEPRLLLAADPQELIYLLNYARHDPAGYEAETGLNLGLSQVASRAPLAVSSNLMEAAVARATEMATANYLAHQSPITGKWPNEIVRSAGYALPAGFADGANDVESIIGGASLVTAKDTLNALLADGGAPASENRARLLGLDPVSAGDREIGASAASNATADLRNYWVVQTAHQDSSERFLTGVIFDDLNRNGRFDAGEGLSGVSVRAGNQVTTSNASGGWSIRDGSGGVEVTVSGGSFKGFSKCIVGEGSANVELDFISNRPTAVIDFHYWHNTLLRWDASYDGLIVPGDALAVINDINSFGSRKLPNGPNALGEAPPTFLDVDGDSFVAPGDALEIINYINSHQGDGALAPDPTFVAPPVDASTYTDFGTAAAFLYSGPKTIQTGVGPGTIEPSRTAVLRGRTLSADNAPLAGVTMSVLGHPEFGETRTRTDGMFDLVVNGGGELTVRYQKAGYLPAQRQVNAVWQDYAWLSDVVLIPLDDQVTTIDLASPPAPIQAARGTTETDVDGVRRGTLLFPSGVQATMTLPDQSTQALSKLDIRVTEYTVGANGRLAMPADLPASSGYTYAVELSVDQALKAGASRVDFTQAVPFYVENFLQFPVGMAVPAGYYDRARDMWVPSDNGRVIAVVSEVGGIAQVDTNGDGSADDDLTLGNLGISVAELKELASLYNAGQSLWRVPVTHFTSWDCNWPYGPPSDARPPSSDLNDGKVDDPNLDCGSIIEVENQTLSEAIQITGTPFSLTYSSDRVPGRSADRTIEIPLTQQTLPAGIRRVELGIEVGGRRFTSSFTPAPNLTTAFSWDGFDAYGRRLQGSQPITVSIGYVYQAVYYKPADGQRAFSALSGVPLSANRARQEFTLYQHIRSSIGATDTTGIGLGGWSLDVLHSYDSAGQKLHLGDGGDRSAKGDVFSAVSVAVGKTITVNEYTRYADGTTQPSGDGGLAKDAGIWADNIATGPDGSLYVIDGAYNNRVRRVSPDGIITTFAGTGAFGFSGDGGPATQASVQQPADVAVGPDGSVYIAASNRVRRVAPDGIITTIAGNGSPDFSGDGGPATSAGMSPIAVAVGPDGSLYIADYRNNRLRRVTPDGNIRTIAGNGTAPGSVFRWDGKPAIEAPSTPLDVAVGPDGSIYMADLQDGGVRRISPDGIITTPVYYASFYGRPGQPRGVAVGLDGKLYIANRSRVERVEPNGDISIIAGSDLPAFGYKGDEGPATKAVLNPYHLAIGPDGSIYFSDEDIYRILRVGPALPRFSEGDITLPSEDGSEIYHFDASGRHLRTLNALTGAVIYSFSYDAAGRLTSVTDADNNLTTVEHDGNGNATSLVGPYGQRTALTVNRDGYLATVKNPAAETISFAYRTGGLLTSLSDPRNNTTKFDYDELGRLVRDEDAENGLVTLSREDLSAISWRVTTKDGENGTRKYTVEAFSDGGVRRTVSDGAGLATVTTIGTNGTRSTTLPDGTVISTELGADARFGMQAPIVTKETVRTPSGLTSTTSASRVATLALSSDPTRPISSQSDSIVVNGNSYKTVYDAVSRTITNTSAEGRRKITTIDAQGRPLAVAMDGVLPANLSYDGRGRLASVVQGNRTITYAYDASGRLASITDPVNRTVAFEYDTAGRLTRETEPDGSEIDFSYDAAGNLVSLRPPGKPEHTFAYDANDRLTAATPPNVGAGSDTTSYVYNRADEIIRSSLANGSEIKYAWCECGRLSSIDAPWGTYSYAYNGTTGQLSSLTSPGGFQTSFSHDGLLETATTLSGPVSAAVTWTYDSNLRVKSEAVNGVGSVSYAYDKDGLLTQAGALAITRDSANGRMSASSLGAVSDTLGYNAFGEVASYDVRVSQKSIMQIAYVRDDLGRVIRKTETVAGVVKAFDYSYDPNGRLAAVNEDGFLVQTYSYDANGNRVAQVTPTGITTATYDNQDRLLTYGTKRYAYSADGSLNEVDDLASGERAQYTYDGFGNLTRVVMSNGRVVEYLIDGQDRRVGKKVNGSIAERLVYRTQFQPIASLDAVGNVSARYIYAAGANVPDYMIKDNISYRLVTDQLGSVRIVINTADGSVAQQLDYDVFGNVVLDSNPGFQPFGFSGGLYDSDTRMVRFGARDYDPTVGRWTTRDSLGFKAGDSNLYCYARNDPVNYVDPTGHFVPVLVGVAVGLGISVALDWFLAPNIANAPSPTDVTHNGTSDQEYLVRDLISAGAAGLGVNLVCKALRRVPLSKIDPNKLHHIFDQARHGLDSLVNKFGSQESAFRAIEDAARGVANSKGITGVFEETVMIAGEQVTVRGNVVNGAVKIGTAFK